MSEIQPDPTACFHGNRFGYDGKKWCLHFLSAVFHPFLFLLAGNVDMHKNSDEVKFRPEWTTDCGVSFP